MSLRAKFYAFFDIVLLAAGTVTWFVSPPENWHSSTVILCGLFMIAVALNTFALIRAGIESRKLASEAHGFVVDRIVNLRRPLQGLVGIQDLFSQDKSPVEPKEYLEIADFCARYLIRQLDRMQFFSELAQGSIGSRPRRSNLREIVRNAIEVAREQTNNRDVTISEDWEFSVPVEVSVDDRLLTKALTELLDNAAQYGGGYPVVLRISHQPGQLTFSVADHGPGLSREQDAALAKVSGDTSKSWNEVRSGLGLFIIRQISNALGATINIKSQKGAGTGVTLTLPLTTAEQPVVSFEPRRVSKLHRRPLHALIADDDEITSKVMGTILQALDITTVVAKDGKEAVVAAQKHSFDVIFMDIEMPVMDGWQASSIILNDLSLHKRPHIVALTSYCRQEDQDKARSLGLLDLVAKPAHLEQIKNILEKVYEARESTDKVDDGARENVTWMARKDSDSGPLVNVAELENRFGGNKAMCQSVLANAAQIISAETDRMADALSRRDAVTLSSAIHKMQGEFAVILCSRGVNLCQKFTASAKIQDWDMLERDFKSFADLVEQLHSELDSSSAAIAA